MVFYVKADYHSTILLSVFRISTVPVADALIGILNHKRQGKSLSVDFHTSVESKDLLYHPEKQKTLSYRDVDGRVCVCAL